MDALLVDNFYLKQKENIYLINIKETELACAGQTYLEYFLPGTPLLTSHPPPLDTKEEKQMIIRTKIMKCLRKDTSQSMLL